MVNDAQYILEHSQLISEGQDEEGSLIWRAIR